MEKLNNETQANTRAMDVKQAAFYCGLSKSTLDKMRSSGNGPKFIRLGSRCVYLRDDLDDFLNSKPRFKSTAEADVYATQATDQ